MTDESAVVPADTKQDTRRFFQPKAPHKKAPKTPIALGVRRSRNGSLETRVRAGGRIHQRIFPPGTDLETAVAWREHTKATCVTARDVPPYHRSLTPTLNGWCYVYFVQQARAVKIGRAVDVRRRLEELQTASAAPLTLLVAVAAHASLETEILKRLAPYRLGGEWFIFGPEIAHLVRQFQKGANPVEVLFSWSQSMPPCDRPNEIKCV